MSDKNIKLKDGDNVLYPQTKIENVVDFTTKIPTIYSGTSAPDDSLGKDGDIYVRYSE